MTKYKPLFAYTLKSLIKTVRAFAEEDNWTEDQIQEVITRIDTKLREIEPHYDEKIQAKESTPQVIESDPMVKYEDDGFIN